MKTRATAQQKVAYRRAHGHKSVALNYVWRATKAGLIERAPCMICGRVDHVHAHHDNYCRPADVTWLCPVHHAERHKAMTPHFDANTFRIPTLRGATSGAASSPSAQARSV